MKQRFICVFCVCLARLAGAAPFQNLGFDQTVTNNVTIEPLLGGARIGNTVHLVPAWELSVQGAPLSRIFYNDCPLGLGWVAVFPKDNIGQPAYPVSGLYSVAASPSSDPRFSRITMGQHGDIPTQAKTITFINYGGSFELRLNGQRIALTYQYAQEAIQLGDRPVRVASGDISAFAGQTVEMAFTASFKEGEPLIHGLDSISFSP